MSTDNHQLPPKATESRASKIEKQLDDALADSFPASDPVSIVTSQVEEDWIEQSPSPPSKP
jgi:hypothetical protein